MIALFVLLAAVIGVLLSALIAFVTISKSRCSLRPLHWICLLFNTAFIGIQAFIWLICNRMLSYIDSSLDSVSVITDNFVPAFLLNKLSEGIESFEAFATHRIYWAIGCFVVVLILCLIIPGAPRSSVRSGGRRPAVSHAHRTAAHSPANRRRR